MYKPFTYEKKENVKDPKYKPCQTLIKFIKSINKILNLREDTPIEKI